VFSLENPTKAESRREKVTQATAVSGSYLTINPEACWALQ